MKGFLSFLKYIFSVAATPVSLILLWVFNIRPVSFAFSLFNYQLSVQNIETTTAALDLAFLVLIYNIVGKLLSKIKKPITLDISIEDSTDPNNDPVVKYDPTQGLKKLKCKVTFNYRHPFLRRISTLCSHHIIEIHWSEWITIEIDEPVSLNLLGVSNKNSWASRVTAQLGPYDTNLNLVIPFYFTVKNSYIKDGSIFPKVKFHSNIIAHCLIRCVASLFISINESKIQIRLIKE